MGLFKKKKKEAFIGNVTNYSVYETPKHFVKNEIVYQNGSHKIKHTYRKKTKALENKLNKAFGKPTNTQKHGRVWH